MISATYIASSSGSISQQSNSYSFPQALPITGQKQIENVVEEEEDDFDDTRSQTSNVTYAPSYNMGGQNNINASINLPQSICPIVKVDFNNGYIIRQLYEFFKDSISIAPMFFDQNGITIERHNGAATMNIKCRFDRKDLIGYYFDINKCNDPVNKRHILTFDIENFLTQIKSVVAKEGLIICQYSEYSNHIICKPYGGDKNSQDGIITLNMQRYDPQQCDIDDGIKNDTFPNQVVPLVSFCNVCKNVSTSKSPFSYFLVYCNGVRIMAANEINSIGRKDGWGDYSGYEAKPSLINIGQYDWVPIQPFYSCISSDDNKSLIKLVNLQKGGVIRIYSNKHQIVRLEMKVGCNCDMTITLQGKNPDEMTTSTGKKKKILK